MTLTRPKFDYRKLLGVFLVAASVGFNKWSVQALATSDGQINSELFIYAIIGIQILLGTMGLSFLNLERQRLWLALILLGFVLYVWAATRQPTESFEHFFLAYLPQSFYLNVLLSIAALLAYVFTTRNDRRRDIAQNVALSVATFGFVALLIELPALTGFIDYRQVFIPKGVGLTGPHNRIYEPGGFFHRPANDQYSEVRPGDSVLTLGAQTNRLYEADYTYDQNGFRNSTPIANPDLLLVGDSFIEGYKVGQDATVTEQIMQGSNYTAISLAQSDYSLYHGLSAMLHYLEDYSPRVVVWFLFEGNDLPYFPISHDKFVSRSAASAEPARFSERSFFGSLSSSLASWSSLAVRSLQQDNYARTRSGNFPDVAWSDETAMYFDYGPPERAETRLPYLKDLLVQGDALVRENGATLLVAHIPMKIDVYRDLLAFPNDSVVQDWVPLELAAELQAWADENSLNYMDLTPALQQAAADGALVYFLDDAHWTPEGHQVVARTVLDHLTMKGWLD
ncbi:alginate O-acetyltransferase AlgX-related protein [Ruegeria meonggei]|uniref:alginate O-acetyltransferase AlgX-related protein n=1 Tax=Ruegeria meonggei TaxID=1446476 RepID=UPI00366E1DEA